MILEGKKCVLRPWREKDVPSLARYANDRRVWERVSDYFPHPYTPADALAFIAFARAKREQEDFAVEVGGEAVGGIGYIPQADVRRISAEVGYWIGEPFQGRGIMTEAVRMLSDHLLETGRFTHLFAPVFGFNAASMRVLEKAGFSGAGVLHRAAVKNGFPVDLHFFEKLNP